MGCKTDFIQGSFSVVGDLNVEWGYESAKIIEPDVYEFDFKNDKGFGSFSATTNWLARADVHFNKIDMNYDRTLDYIMAIKVCLHRFKC